MMDKHSYPYGAQRNIQPNTSHQSPQKLTSSLEMITFEELEELDECQYESTYNGGMTVGAAVMGGYCYMISKGILKRNIPGIILSGITGFCIGKKSYTVICMWKIMSRPNSNLKNILSDFRAMQPQVRVDVNSGELFFDSNLPSSDTSQGNDELRRHNSDEYYKSNSMPSGPRGPAPPSSSLYSPPSPSDTPLQQSPTQSSPYSQTSAQQNIQPNTSHQSPRNQSSSLEMMTFEVAKKCDECEYKSIYHSGMPVGAAVMGGYCYMISKGILKRNIPGIILSGITGFWIGEKSYREICLRKVLSRPNSTLKNRSSAFRAMQPQVRVDVNSGELFVDSNLPSSDTSQGNDELRRHNSDEYYKSNSMPSGPRGPAPPSSSLYSPPSPSDAPLQQSPTQSSPYSQTGFYNDRPPESARSSNRTSE